MNIFGTIKGFFVTSESDIMAFMKKVWDEAPIAEAEIAAAAGWVIKTGLPAVVRDVQAITPFVSVLGAASGHPELAASMNALNVAMAGINAFAGSSAAGTLTADQVVQGYANLKNASAAASSVVSIAATIVAVTPATMSK